MAVRLSLVVLESDADGTTSVMPLVRQHTNEYCLHRFGLAHSRHRLLTSSGQLGVRNVSEAPSSDTTRRATCQVAEGCAYRKIAWVGHLLREEAPLSPETLEFAEALGPSAQDPW